MAMRRSWFAGFSLVLGALLVGVAGLFHPMLEGDGPAQLDVIAATAAWHTIHWAFLFGFPLVIAGLAGVSSRHGGTPGEGATRIGICLAVFAYAVAVVGILFMAGAAPALADAYHRADLGLAATHAVFGYDMLRPFAQGSIRAAAFAISLATYAYGWGVVSGGVAPRALGFAGVGLGVIGAVVAVALPESNAYVVLGTALATLWQLGAGAWLLLPPKGPAA